jgi:hypothetical protein
MLHVTQQIVTIHYLSPMLLTQHLYNLNELVLDTFVAIRSSFLFVIFCKE